MMKNSFEQVMLDQIIDYGKYPNLADIGSNDQEGYQIFTPDFIVKDMIKLIGNDNVANINATVLEPTSGDGAFTVRILELRLIRLSKDKDYLKKSLIALSNIFSIEMDEELINKQRNNIFTLLMLYAKKEGDKITLDYVTLAKKIILTNFIWGETSIDRTLVYKGQPMGWYMPTYVNNKSRKTEKNRILFARWTIQSDFSLSTFEYEDWEASVTGNSDSDLGGLFSEQYE